MVNLPVYTITQNAFPAHISKPSGKPDSLIIRFQPVGMVELKQTNPINTVGQFRIKQHQLSPGTEWQESTTWTNGDTAAWCMSLGFNT